MCLAARRVVSIAFKYECMLSRRCFLSFSFDSAIAFINFVLSFETIEFRRFESDGDIDSDLPPANEHGRRLLTAVTFDVSSHREERQTERQLFGNGRR